MIFQEIFNNQLEFLFPEFFLTIIFLVLLLFGVFFSKNQNFQEILILKNITSIIIYLLLILFLLTVNIPNITHTVLNGVFVITNFTQFIKCVLILSTLVWFLVQQDYLIQQKINFYEIHILILIALLGLMVLISSNHFITFYLAIELQSLSFYVLASMQRKSVLSVEAGLKYFILGSIASGFILYGSSILYGILGSLNFSSIFLIISNINFLNHTDILISLIYAFFFVVVGILFKIGASPFHFWLPDVYEGAPNNISAFFAIVPKISYIGILIRLYFNIFFPISYFFEVFFYCVSFLSMVVGSLSSLQQNKIKRFLAYSSISHVGFILIGFTSNKLCTIPFILLYVIIYMITSISIWTSYLSININHKPIKYITDFAAIHSINKGISLVLVINLFSLAGIPPLAGFFSKFFIFLSAIQNNHFGLVCGAIIVSIISSFYYLRIIKIIFFEKVVRTVFISQMSKSQSIVLSLSVHFILFFFFYPNIILTYLNKIYLYLLV